MKQTVIILIPCDIVSDGRKVLETIENDTFNSKDELLNRICYEEDNPIDVEKVIILPLTEYMDMCNDTDSDTKEEYSVDNVWFGYAQIQQEKKKEVKK